MVFINIFITNVVFFKTSFMVHGFFIFSLLNTFKKQQIYETYEYVIFPFGYCVKLLIHKFSLKISEIKIIVKG